MGSELANEFAITPRTTGGRTAQLVCSGELPAGDGTPLEQDVGRYSSDGLCARAIGLVPSAWLDGRDEAPVKLMRILRACQLTIVLLLGNNCASLASDVSRLEGRLIFVYQKATAQGRQGREIAWLSRRYLGQKDATI